jgi:hypothetical protein
VFTYLSSPRERHPAVFGVLPHSSKVLHARFAAEDFHRVASRILPDPVTVTGSLTGTGRKPASIEDVLRRTTLPGIFSHAPVGLDGSIRVVFVLQA